MRPWGTGRPQAREAAGEGGRARGRATLPGPGSGSGTRAGVVLACAAFGAWGIVPVYYKAVAEVPATEVLGHRILWSLAVLAPLLLLLGRGREVREALCNRRSLALLAASSVLVAVNWLVFTYAIAIGRVMDCSLGYFINPLVTVLLGTLLLRERLRWAQIVAVSIAGVAVTAVTIAHGSLPWIALLLAGTFALYGLVRKVVAVESIAGLTVETLLLSPFALGYLVWLELRGVAHFGSEATLSVLLASAGIVTAVPLIWFVSGARRLPLSTVGLLQYIAPTLQFLLGILVYGEPFTPARAASFAAVWVALAIFSLDGLAAARARARLKPRHVRPEA